MARYFHSRSCLSSVLSARPTHGRDPGPGRISWTGTLTEGETLTFIFVVTNTVAQAEVTNTAYFSSALQTGPDSAVYSAGGWKVWLPLVIRGSTP